MCRFCRLKRQDITAYWRKVGLTGLLPAVVLLSNTILRARQNELSVVNRNSHRNSRALLPTVKRSMRGAKSKDVAGNFREAARTCLSTIPLTEEEARSCPISHPSSLCPDPDKKARGPRDAADVDGLINAKTGLLLAATSDSGWGHFSTNDRPVVFNTRRKTVEHRKVTLRATRHVEGVPWQSLKCAPCAATRHSL